jgi:pilus assembly protein CpaB
MFLRVSLIVFALIAAGGAAWFSMGLRSTPEVQQEQEKAEVPTKDILVAVEAISGGEVLSPDKVRWQPFPEPSLNDQYILREEQPEAISELSGSFVNRAFAIGEPIREERLMETNINLLSNKIAAGMRAIAVKITAENTAGGFILPGDRVDVIHTVTMPAVEGQPVRNEAQIIITNARVMAIDQTAVQNPEGSAIGSTATLELTPQESERIIAAEASGLLSLILRAVSDHAEETAEVRDEQIRSVRIHRGQETTTITLN